MITIIVGAIEVSVFSEHYQTELDVVDIQTQRIDRFGKCSNLSHFSIDFVLR